MGVARSRGVGRARGRSIVCLAPAPLVKGTSRGHRSTKHVALPSIMLISTMVGSQCCGPHVARKISAIASRCLRQNLGTHNSGRGRPNLGRIPGQIVPKLGHPWPESGKFGPESVIGPSWQFSGRSLPMSVEAPHRRHPLVKAQHRWGARRNPCYTDQRKHCCVPGWLCRLRRERRHLGRCPGRRQCQRRARCRVRRPARWRRRHLARRQDPRWNRPSFGLVRPSKLATFRPISAIACGKQRDTKQADGIVLLVRRPISMFTRGLAEGSRWDRVLGTNKPNLLSLGFRCKGWGCRPSKKSDTTHIAPYWGAGARSQ